MKGAEVSKTVFTAIVGNPNVGKSTLLNRLTGVKIAITSHKPQTTRTRITGILTEGGVQYVFIDTPGFHHPRTKLAEQMQKAIGAAVEGVDVALLVVTPKEALDETEKQLLGMLKRAGTPVVLAMNKSDTLASATDEKRLLESLASEGDFAGILSVSALKGDGIDALKALLAERAEEGPLMFDEDTLTDIPEKTIVSELIRESLLKFLFEELPHGTAVIIESFKERPTGGIVDIDATVICEKNSHKGMIIGKGGSMLKKIATSARLNIESFLSCRVNLQVRVKVRENWRNNERYLREISDA